jgi:hypothetical protein
MKAVADKALFRALSKRLTGKIALECGACGFRADFVLARICDRAGFMNKPRCPACDGPMWVYRPQATEPIVGHTDLQRDLDHEDGTEDFEREERR